MFRSFHNEKVLCFGALLFLAGCQTVSVDSETNDIQAERIALNTYFDKDEYTVIGTAKAESEFVYWSEADKKYIGDSEKYGYILEREEFFVGNNVYVGTGKKASSKAEEQALHIARLNANYKLIEEAYAMGGDEIFEPVYTVEMQARDGYISDEGYKNGVVKYKVTVRAKVIQLKLQ